MALNLRGPNERWNVAGSVPGPGRLGRSLGLFYVAQRGIVPPVPADRINLLSAGATIKTGSRTLKNKHLPEARAGVRSGVPAFRRSRGAKSSNCSHHSGFTAAIVVVSGCSGSPFLLHPSASGGAVINNRGRPASDGTSTHGNAIRAAAGSAAAAVSPRSSLTFQEDSRGSRR